VKPRTRSDQSDRSDLVRIPVGLRRPQDVRYRQSLARPLDQGPIATPGSWGYKSNNPHVATPDPGKRRTVLRHPKAPGLSMLRLRTAAAVALCVTALPAWGEAQYIKRYPTTTSGTTNGAVTLTGNTPGLDGAGAPNQNGHGMRGSIGTFITTNTALRDVTPLPTSAPQFPAGTTADWTQNSSSAELRLPAGARVLHAELVWGGSWACGGEKVAAFLNNPVTLTTPAGSFPVTPDASTGGTAGATGNCTSATHCFYTRSANVTTLVQQAASRASSARSGFARFGARCGRCSQHPAASPACGCSLNHTWRCTPIRKHNSPPSVCIAVDRRALGRGKASCARGSRQTMGCPDPRPRKAASVRANRVWLRGGRRSLTLAASRLAATRRVAIGHAETD
jgi:hypothetical protein